MVCAENSMECHEGEESYLRQVEIQLLLRIRKKNPVLWLNWPLLSVLEIGLGFAKDGYCSNFNL